MADELWCVVTSGWALKSPVKGWLSGPTEAVCRGEWGGPSNVVCRVEFVGASSLVWRGEWEGLSIKFWGGGWFKAHQLCVEDEYVCQALQ